MMAVTKHPLIFMMRAIIWRNDRILLIRHSPNDGHAPDRWEFPGGKVDVGDENLYAAIKRETLEETGLAIELMAPIWIHNEVLPERSKYPGAVHITLFCCCRLVNESNEIVSDEHFEVLWCSEKEALELPLTDEGTHEAIIQSFELRRLCDV